MMITKKYARQSIKMLRENYDIDFVTINSKIICDKIIESAEYSAAQNLYVYMSFNNETDTSYLIDRAVSDGKKIFIPKVVGDDMIFYRYYPENVISGYMGIIEPDATTATGDGCEGMLIVPGVAFDRKCNRTGYGKGFYDRYIMTHPKLFKAGIGFEQQIFDELEVDEYDQPLDVVFSEKKIYRRLTI